MVFQMEERRLRGWERRGSELGM